MFDSEDAWARTGSQLDPWTWWWWGCAWGSWQRDTWSYSPLLPPLEITSTRWRCQPIGAECYDTWPIVNRNFDLIHWTLAKISLLLSHYPRNLIKLSSCTWFCCFTQDNLVCLNETFSWMQNDFIQINLLSFYSSCFRPKVDIEPPSFITQILLESSWELATWCLLHFANPSSTTKEGGNRKLKFSFLKKPLENIWAGWSMFYIFWINHFSHLKWSIDIIIITLKPPFLSNIELGKG